MSNGEVLKRGAENIKSYLEEIQENVRDDVLSAVSILSVATTIKYNQRDIDTLWYDCLIIFTVC